MCLHCHFFVKECVVIEEPDADADADDVSIGVHSSGSGSRTQQRKSVCFYVAVDVFYMTPSSDS